ncbi:MAG: protein kinase [Fimbriimonadaceae bacterium]|nr:protein kinase [Fimbriimonadaceae bacterium]QYK55851.1 MAG: protein kinase [Fimbriimonadaceae bacterium]
MIGSLLAVRYELQQELEGSPLFSVYRALDRTTGKDVKVRLLKSEFASERSYLAAVKTHVNHVRLIEGDGVEKTFEAIEEGDSLLVVSEYLPSATLEDRLRRLATFSVQLALATAIQICDALGPIHAQKMAHGDLGARHVLLSGAGQVTLTMTGFWETYASSSKAGLAMLRGMAPYLAPEVTAGEMPSPSSDIYSLGVLLYQMLSGRLPYPGDSTMAIATKHSTAPYPTIRATNPSVPPALDELVRRCMSKSPSERYASVEKLAEDLRTVQDALRFGRPLSWPIQKAVVSAPQAVVPKVEDPIEPEPMKPKGRAKTKAKANPLEPEETDGVPMWLAAIVYASTALVALLIGGWVFFNLQTPKLIDLPNVVGMSQAEAASALDKIGLRLRVDRQEASEKFPQGIVLSQEPSAGSRKVREHSFVQVVLSAGGRNVEVPDLRGRSLDEAERLLSSMNLVLADQIERVRDPELEAGLIVSQVPSWGKKLERGSRVRVRVSSGKEGPRQNESLPSNTYKLKVTMPPGTKDVKVRIDMTDDRDTKTIHEATHSEGETFEVSDVGYGKEAIFRVFFDGDLVSQMTKQAEEVSGQ